MPTAWRVRLLATWLLGLLCCLSAPARAAVTIEATLDRATVPMNGHVTLTITVAGSAQAAAPTLPDLPEFGVVSAGVSHVQSWVNLRGTTSTIHTYRLFPKRTGALTIPPIVLEHDNERLTTPAMTINVVEAALNQPPVTMLPRQSRRGRSGQADRWAVFMEAEAEPSTAYVGEQVTLVIRFYWSVRLVGNAPLQRPSVTGFWIEELGEPRRFLTDVDGRRYDVYEVRYALFPTAAGAQTIGPARVECQVVAGRRRQRNDPFSLFDMFGGQAEARTVQTDPIEIEVVELPRSGRPGSWNGAVGQYTLSAALDRREVEVGAAVTLSVTIQGFGNTRSVGDPELPEVEGLRSYMAETTIRDLRQADRLGGARTLQQVYIPAVAGTHTIPAVAYAYFDPQTGAYHQLEAGPLELRVLSGNDGGGGGAVARQRQVLGGVVPDLSFIRLGDPGLGRRTGPLHRSLPFWLLQLVPLVGVAAGLLYARHVERVRGDVGYARLRRSGRVARRRLAEARRCLAAGAVDTFLSALSAALVGYVADRVNQPAPGMTLAEARAHLEERGVESSWVDQFTRCVERCDFGRFAPGMEAERDCQQLLDEAAVILKQLGKAGV